jgi:hypothetical protein
MKETINNFLKDILSACFLFKMFNILNIKIKQDIEKWYEADIEYNKSTFNDNKLPWPIVDIVWMNIKRYGKDEPSLGGTLHYLKTLVSKYNNCL